MEEISLRELIEILLRRKYIIIGITVGALFASFIYSYFIVTPEYQARAVLKIANYQANGSKNIKVLRTNPGDYLPLAQGEEFLTRVAASIDIPGGYEQGKFPK